MSRRRRSLLLIILLLATTSCVAIASASSGPVPSDELPDSVDDIENITQHPSPDPVSASFEGAVTYIVVADDDVTSSQLKELRSLGASVEQNHGNLVHVQIDPSDRSVYSRLGWVERLRKPIRPVRQNVGGEGATAIGADALHDEGVNGKNATVVIIDQGFDPNEPEIADNVVDARGFGTTIDASPKHGTASAEMVLDVAPEADLYLAAISNSVGYRNALDWAIENDADVVTMSLGFLAQPNDGTGPVSQRANEAVGEGGFVFTTSTGNQADRHWQGEFVDSDNDDMLEFGGGNEVNYLNSDGGQVSQISANTSLSIVLNWDDWSVASSNFNLYLVYASSPGAELQYVDRVDTDNRGARPTKRSVVTVSSDGYYGVMVEQTHGGNEDVELFTNKNLEHRTPESSIVSPAVAEETVGVGAVQYDSIEVEPYSSRGPTNSGAQGVTFVAPTCATSATYSGPFCGTSGAAPHAGGAAGLLISEYSLNRTETQGVMTYTADDISVSDYVGGSGLLNLTRSVENITEDGTQVDGPLPPDHIFADQNGYPIDPIPLLEKLGEWDSSGEIDGQEFRPIKLLQRLGEWDKAR